MDKLICVGKNYLEHARELGDPVPEKPVLFLKPPSTVCFVPTRQEIPSVNLPKGRGAIHHECEIVLRLNSKLIPEAVTLGLDLTLRDEQAALKKKGHPWEVSKVFRNSAVVGPWIPVSDFPNYLSEEFSFALDGKIRQRGIGTQMRFSPDECLRYAKEYFPLESGDLLFTGTPEGVGPIEPGQVAEIKWGSKLIYSVRFE